MNSDWLPHAVTNESIRAIIAALEPTIGDSFLSVCSSGDLPFIFSEFGEVVAVDINPKQIEYAKKRRDYLANGDVKEFLRPNRELKNLEPKCKAEIDEYLLEGDRINRIKANLDKINFIVGDLSKQPFENQFTKAYLSNILSASCSKFPDYCDFFRRVASKLKNDGLIYISDNDYLLDRKILAEYNGGDYGSIRDWPRNLIQVTYRTNAAIPLDKAWNPAVYQLLRD